MNVVLTLVGVGLGIIVAAVAVYALCAPVETIAWWRGWGKSRAPAASPIARAAPSPVAAGVDGAEERPADQYVVYLSGVGRLSGEEVPDKEGAFLDMVASAMPGLVMVRDVFPYSPSGTPLTEHHLLAPVWSAIPRIARRSRRLMVLYHIIYFYNLLKVGVSRDARYGPAFSYGAAKEMLKGLLRNGYRIDRPRPVTVLCISGGGQVAQAAAPYLKRWLGAPIRIVSIGSVLTGEPGTADVEHIYHLSGSKDVTQYVGRVLDPLSWPIFPHSAWNRAMTSGGIDIIPVGPMKHMGWGDYFSRSVRLPDGRPHAQFVAEVVVSLLSGQRHPGYRPATEAAGKTPAQARVQAEGRGR